MRKLFTLLVFIGTCYLANAQNISQSQMAMSEGINNAYTLSVAENIKFSKSVWKEYMGNFGRIKKNKQKELTSLGASIGDLASRPIDVFASFEKLGKEETLIHVWFKTENGYFSAEHEEDNEKVVAFLEEYKKEVVRTKVRTELKKAEKNLKKKDGEVSKLIKKNERLHKDIKNYEKKIQKAKEAIEKNEKEQEAAKRDLETQKGVVEDVKKQLNDI